MHTRFSLPEEIYLLNHSVGCPPKEQPHLDSFLSSWRLQGGTAWDSWLEIIYSFQKAMATLLNTTPSQICPQTNVSSALTKILYSLPLHPKKKTLLLSERDFPSLGFVCQQAERTGFKLKFIPKDSPIHEVGVWEKALTPDVFATLITHVTSLESLRAPVQGITALTKERGVHSIVDVTQSAGIIPINLADWSADFLIGSSVKWLCGGPGAGFLWASDTILPDCKPLDVGWFSHEEPFAFDIHDFRYAKDARRFWGGTPSILPFAAATDGIEVTNSIGVEQIHAHNQMLTEKLLRRAREKGFLIHSPIDPKLRGGTIVIKEQSGASLHDWLHQHGVLVDERSGVGCRLSPHIYSRDEEIEFVMTLLEIYH